MISILGVLAALAVPNLAPLLQLGRLDGAAQQTAGFVESVRESAVADGRCHRVRVSAPRTLVDERRTGTDCVNLAAEGWSEVRRLPLDAGTTLALAATTAAPTAPDDNALVLRPSSRLWGDGDRDVGDDHARITVRLAATTGTRSVEITSAGRVCVRSHTGSPPAIAVSSCP